MSRALLLCLLAIACGTRDRPRGVPNSGGDAGRTDVGTPDSGVGREPTERLDPESCVDTSDCASGSRCNLTLTPPRCQRLFCGPAGTLCSEESLCQTMHLCEEGVCRPCADCGGTCAVLESNRAHCGGCDMPVRPDQRCVNGQPACEEGAVECSGSCVSLETSPDHCGGCNRPCSASCVSDQCVEIAGVQGTTPASCTSICGGMGFGPCTIVKVLLPGVEGDGAGAAVYDDQSFMQLYLIATCDEIPPTTLDGLPYAGSACYCRVP